VVFIGSGFTGVAATKQLASTNANISLIDKINYHVFQPLPYQHTNALSLPKTGYSLNLPAIGGGKDWLPQIQIKI